MATFSPKLSVLTSLYRAEAFLPAFLEQVREQSMFSQLELVLVLNAPSRSERSQARAFARQYPEQVQLLEVKEVEPLGASWNRAWQAARAPYLAIWNVDDQRQPDSLERQVAALDAHADWALCYGDYLRVAAYGDRDGLRRHPARFSQRYYRRAFPQGGAFWVFRKAVAERIGYFDEQFQVGPDLDLSLRMAVAGLSMGRVDGLLGCFTDAEQGLSTRDGARRSAVERTAIQLRYGIYDKVRSEYLEQARAYRLKEVLNFGQWRPLDDVIPSYRGYLRRRRPLWVLGRLRNALRSFFQRLGILDWLYRLQQRVIKREI